MDPKHHPLILAVDDTPRDLDLLVTLLERQGYEVASAVDGAQALEQVAKHQPDLILLDIQMPGMDGLETCRRLKAEPSTQDIPVIFLTALIQSSEILAGFAAGAVDYVTKPFQVPELLARVLAHVELRLARKKIHILQGFLPTCAHCKKIRDEQGTWHALETYITEHSEAQFSHGLCPDCIPTYFPDYRAGLAASGRDGTRS